MNGSPHPSMSLIFLGSQPRLEDGLADVEVLHGDARAVEHGDLVVAGPARVAAVEHVADGRGGDVGRRVLEFAHHARLAFEVTEQRAFAQQGHGQFLLAHGVRAHRRNVRAGAHPGGVEQPWWGRTRSSVPTGNPVVRRPDSGVGCRIPCS